jgi:hypothetical protein
LYAALCERGDLKLLRNHRVQLFPIINTYELKGRRESGEEERKVSSDVMTSGYSEFTWNFTGLNK